MSSISNTSNFQLVDKQKYQQWLMDCLPATVLRRLPAGITPSLEGLRAQAFIDLDSVRDAQECLELVLNQPEIPDRPVLESIWAHTVLHYGHADGAVQTALHTVAQIEDEDDRAFAMAVAASGYTKMHCWRSAEQLIRDAVDLAPINPRIRELQAMIRLEADQRIEARSLYQKMLDLPYTWGHVVGLTGLSQVAFLMGAFDEAWDQAERALRQSNEVIQPLLIMGRIAFARGDLVSMGSVTRMLEERSPSSDGLTNLKQEYNRLAALQSSRVSSRSRRLHAFPTMVQRRNYCGPSTVELVMRYWQNDTSITNDEIAKHVKSFEGGTPIYRIREFFHLVGFDTIRAVVPIEKLKLLVDHGFPAIVQQIHSNSSHVVVVIGYDDESETIELQDPMTHAVVRLPSGTFTRMRRVFQESAVIAYPRDQQYADILSRLDVYHHPAIGLTDRAIMEFEQNNPDKAAALLERAVRRLPGQIAAWVMLLQSYLELWRENQKVDHQNISIEQAVPSSNPDYSTEDARSLFYETLNRAEAIHREEHLIRSLEGAGALLDHDFARALRVFQSAVKADPEDAFLQLSMAECYYLLRQPVKGLEAARIALDIEPSSPAANSWLARCLAQCQRREAVFYAQVAVELSENWWLSHLSLAEALLVVDPSGERSRNSLDKAASMNPGNPEIMVLQASIDLLNGSYHESRQNMHDILARGQSLSPVLDYSIRQFECRLAFAEDKYENALEQVEILLAEYPDDPWGIQFSAAVHCENLLQDDSGVNEQILPFVIDSYEKAISINHGDPSIVRDFLNYISVLAPGEEVLDTVQRIRDSYPDRYDLVFVCVEILDTHGLSRVAAQLVLELLEHIDVPLTDSWLDICMPILVREIGAESTYQLFSDQQGELYFASGVDWERSLGLYLAQIGHSSSGIVRELLDRSFQRHPKDAEIILELGKVVESATQKEELFSQTLLLQPELMEARQRYAAILVENGNPGAALDLVAGHTSESSELRIIQAQALFLQGYFEDAAAEFSDLLVNQEMHQREILEGLWSSQHRSGWLAEALDTSHLGLKYLDAHADWHLRKAITLRCLGKLHQAYAALEMARECGLHSEDDLKFEYELALVEQNDSAAYDWIAQLVQQQIEGNDPADISWAEGQLLLMMAKLGRLHEIHTFIGQKSLNADGWAGAAAAMLRGREYDLAKEYANCTLSIEPGNYRAQLTKAKIMHYVGPGDKAREAFQDLRERFPNEYKAYEVLAQYQIARQELSGALELADRAVYLGAFSLRTWAVRGMVNHLLGQAPDALSDLIKSWNRSTVACRSRMPVYWMALAALQQKPDLFDQWRSVARKNTTRELTQKILAQVHQKWDRESDNSIP